MSSLRDPISENSHFVATKYKSKIPFVDDRTEKLGTIQNTLLILGRRIANLLIRLILDIFVYSSIFVSISFDRHIAPNCTFVGNSFILLKTFFLKTIEPQLFLPSIYCLISRP